MWLGEGGDCYYGLGQGYGGDCCGDPRCSSHEAPEGVHQGQGATHQGSHQDRNSRPSLHGTAGSTALLQQVHTVTVQQGSQEAAW